MQKGNWAEKKLHLEAPPNYILLYNIKEIKSNMQRTIIKSNLIYLSIYL